MGIPHLVRGAGIARRKVQLRHPGPEDCGSAGSEGDILDVQCRNAAVGDSPFIDEYGFTGFHIKQHGAGHPVVRQVGNV